MDFEVDGDIAAREQGPANAEALEQATALLRDLRGQGSSSSAAFVATPDADYWDEDAAPSVEALTIYSPILLMY